MILPKGFNVTKDGRVFTSQGKELKQYNRKGYPYIVISGKKYSIHRIVALSFIPNPFNKPEVDHIDGNPQNNNVENLRWATRRENEMNPITRKRISNSSKGRARTDEQKKKISIALRGRVQSEETKLKRALKLKDRKRPQYVIDALIRSNQHPVICIDRNTGEEKIFCSQKEAAEYLQMSSSTISGYILGRLFSKKYIWKRI